MTPYPSPSLPAIDGGHSPPVPDSLREALLPLTPEVVTDEYWSQVEPFLPQAALENLSKISQPPTGRGRKPVHPRLILRAIIHVVVNRISWYQLPEATFGLSYGTAAIAFRRWSKDGFFSRLHTAGLASHAEWEGVAWRWMDVNGTWAQIAIPGDEPVKPPKPRHRASAFSLLGENSQISGANIIMANGAKPARYRKYGKIFHNYSDLQLHQKF